MKKEGIISISLNPNGNLVVEYSGRGAQVIDDNHLTNEQKEIKEFFQSIKQQGNKTSLSQNELEKFANQKNNEEGSQGKTKNDNGLLVPVIIAMGVVILILFGVIIYKSK